MLQDYKHLASGQSRIKPGKPIKQFLLGGTILAVAITIVVWLLFFQTSNKTPLQFSFFNPGKIQYDFSAFGRKDQIRLQQIIAARSNAPESQTIIERPAIVNTNAPSVNTAPAPQAPETNTLTTVDTPSNTDKTPNKPEQKEPIDLNTKNILVKQDNNKTNSKLAQTDETETEDDTRKINNTTTEQPKTNNRTALTIPSTSKPDKTTQWHSVIIEPGHTLNQMGVELQLPHKEIGLLLAAAKKHRQNLLLKPGQQIKFLLESQTRRLLSVSYTTDSIFTLTRNNNRFIARKQASQRNFKLVRVTGSINTNLFEAGRKAKISDALLLQLAAAFNWDIDFALELRKGDTFTILYKQYENSETGDIVAATINLRGNKLYAIRYTSPTGNTSWYTRDAQLLKTTFLRSPLRLSQQYSSQIDKNKKQNNSTIHYKAPEGTPVKSTATGTITYMGNKRRLGKTVIIRHRNGYTTLYGHLSRFRKHLRPGRRVMQGQVIAYVGKTGTTDSILHYQLRLRGKHLDPLSNITRRKKIARRWRKDFHEKTAVLIQKLDAQ